MVTAATCGALAALSLIVAVLGVFSRRPARCEEDAQGKRRDSDGMVPAHRGVVVMASLVLS